MSAVSTVDDVCIRVFISVVVPVHLERLPEVIIQAFVVRIAVLHDKSRDAFGVFNSQPIADRGSIVLNIKCVLREADLLGEFLNDFGNFVESVIKLVYGRSGTLAVSGIIRCHDMVLISQGRDQVAKHVR